MKVLIIISHDYNYSLVTVHSPGLPIISVDPKKEIKLLGSG